jgi:IS30 family transposase
VTERHVVGSARRDGYSWARIARLLGRSRQAVQQRFRDHDVSWHRPAPEPGDLARRANRAERKEIDAAVLRSRYRDELDRWDASGDDVVPW